MDTLDKFDTYEAALDGFSMELPNNCNVAADCIRNHDNLDRTALYQAYPGGRRETYSFRDLDRMSNKLANALEDDGIEAGDRVIVYLPQIPETMCAHLACWKLGAVSVPLHSGANLANIEQSSEDCEPKIIITNDELIDWVVNVTENQQSIERLVLVGDNDTHDTSIPITTYDEFVMNKSSEFDIIDSTPETPATIVYTSGSTGPPKGVVLSHGSWISRVPGIHANNEFTVNENSVGYHFRSWGTTTSMINIIIEMWYCGGAVVGYQDDSIAPERIIDFLAEFDVTHTFMTPSWIRTMMDVEDLDTYDLSLDVITVGGERLTPEIVDWVDTNLEGVVVNECYGMTELGMISMDCQTWYEQRHGFAGKPIPGQEVAVIDTETGEEKPRGRTGAIAVREDVKSLFLEYWNLPEATTKLKRVDGWVLSGDLGLHTEDGYMRVFGRNDDLVASSGYQLIPDEIESVLIQHDAVAEVGIIIDTDEDLGDIIKAFVELRPDAEPTPNLEAELKQWVMNRLETYKSPDIIIFMSSIPTTQRGKIDRDALVNQ